MELTFEFYTEVRQHCRVLHVLQQRDTPVVEFMYKTRLPAIQTCLPLKMCGPL